MINIIHRYFRSRWERYYFKNHWHFVLDFTLVTLVIILLVGSLGLYFYSPDLPGFGAYRSPSLDLNNPPLDLEMRVSPAYFKAGEAIAVSIKINNNSNEVIGKTTVDFSSLNNNFIVNKIAAANQPGVTVKGRQLILDKIEEGGREVSAQVYFKIKDEAVRLLDWQAKASYAFAGQTLSKVYDLPTMTLAANLSVQSFAYYTSPQGDQLGSGPLPPVVGLPTNYWIFWEAQSAGDFKNLVLSARLPQGLELTARRSWLSGEFNYNQANRQIIWKIPSLKGQSDSYRLGFEVQLIPTAAQVGKILPLTGQLVYYGEDAMSRVRAEGELPALHTDLSGDRFNSGQGEVQAQ